jgi:membrane protease YdiL (CAAX protease family)
LLSLADAHMSGISYATGIHVLSIATIDVFGFLIPMSHDSTAQRHQATRQSAEPFVLVLAMALPSIITFIYFVVLADHDPTVQKIAGGGLKLLQFALPVVWIGLVLRERIQFMRPSSRGLLGALAFGATVATALILLDRTVLEALGVMDVAENAVQQKVRELGFVSRSQYTGLAIFYTLAHSLLEEYYWRWFVFGRMRSYVGATLANIISSAAFVAHHIIVLSRFFGIVSPATWLCSLGVGVGGVVWAWMYDRSDRLFPVWLSHALVDAAIFYVGYRFLFQ